ncbi:ATP-binding protein [Alkalitalea saponilacus]|uniref:AAA+ ATPase domain-containing protein n=1 Tax=Alkalitalea saponilacus TaxID=889453 RepID=A0A1T5GZ75_9BACT|nr:AAA family ATPase [Alkalitalea saponilacus]ASB50972.1 AAA family ATPase [Alkalitalea saponilacus]SKC13717.1 hypothetical protein SAMN03080601_01989 [Alkalitalea saponilacus]
MEILQEKFRKKIARTDLRFTRNILDEINWDARLIGIKGARGVGKTTLLLQYIKLFLSNKLSKTLYVSMDDIWFSEHKLTQLVDTFVKEGGEFLFLDEVHKYPQWSIEIKNIYDDYPDLKIIFTGSSLLEILNARADLSRRAITYTMQGLSFREFLALETGNKYPLITLEDIIISHEQITSDIVKNLKPFQYFENYLYNGYYPFYTEQPDLYHIRLEEIINMILEIELPLLRNVNINYTKKLKQLIYIIAESAPFIPNISKISERSGINRETILNYIHYLTESQILFSAYRNSKGISQLQKPDKLYLENSNLMYTFRGELINKGNMRETFFVNQLKYKHTIELSHAADFIVDQRYSFEIGGKSKNKKQITNLPNAYIVTDNTEIGIGNKIPLWLFGFLY